jgi:hypothetical protein
VRAVFTDSAAFDGAFELNKNVVNNEQLSAASSLLRPFMLRRTKEEVEKKMPPKLETTVTCRELARAAAHSPRSASPPRIGRLAAHVRGHASAPLALIARGGAWRGAVRCAQRSRPCSSFGTSGCSCASPRYSSSSRISIRRRRRPAAPSGRSSRRCSCSCASAATTRSSSRASALPRTTRTRTSSLPDRASSRCSIGCSPSSMPTATASCAHHAALTPRHLPPCASHLARST